MKVSQIKYEVYNNLDIFKFIMAICVIAIHTHPLENISNNIILSDWQFRSFLWQVDFCFLIK